MTHDDLCIFLRMKNMISGFRIALDCAHFFSMVTLRRLVSPSVQSSTSFYSEISAEHSSCAWRLHPWHPRLNVLGMLMRWCSILGLGEAEVSNWMLATSNETSKPLENIRHVRLEPFRLRQHPGPSVGRAWWLSPAHGDVPHHRWSWLLRDCSGSCPTWRSCAQWASRPTWKCTNIWNTQTIFWTKTRKIILKAPVLHLHCKQHYITVYYIHPL